MTIGISEILIVALFSLLLSWFYSLNKITRRICCAAFVLLLLYFGWSFYSSFSRSYGTSEAEYFGLMLGSFISAFVVGSCDWMLDRVDPVTVVLSFVGAAMGAVCSLGLKTWLFEPIILRSWMSRYNAGFNGITALESCSPFICAAVFAVIILWALRRWRKAAAAFVDAPVRTSSFNPQVLWGTFGAMVGIPLGLGYWNVGGGIFFGMACFSRIPLLKWGDYIKSLRAGGLKAEAAAPAHEAPRREKAPVPSAKATRLANDDAGAVRSGIGGGKYELLRQIGEGGMGVVYEGRERLLERSVAVKKLRPELNISLRDKQRFLREAKTSASLHHPCIVDIYAVLEEGDEVFLVFEYVDGKTLDEILDRAPSLPWPEFKPVLKGVCDALSFAHERKVIHRDLKPSNIMVLKGGYAKVMDFGIARQLKDTVSRLTKVDTSGTLAYMAPEQELGRFDGRSDLYSLGATAYEVLSGEVPFPGPNFYLQKEKMTFRPLGEAAPDLPKEVASAVDRCLRFEPKERFQTVEEFSRALRAAPA